MCCYGIRIRLNLVKLQQQRQYTKFSFFIVNSYKIKESKRLCFGKRKQNNGESVNIATVTFNS